MVARVWTNWYTKPKDGYYTDPEAAEFANTYAHAREARLLFSASRGISKEDMEKAVEYIELLKLKHNK